MIVFRMTLCLMAMTGVGAATPEAMQNRHDLRPSAESGAFFTIDLPRGWVLPNGADRIPSADGFLIATSANRIQGVGLAHGDADISVQRVARPDLVAAVDDMERLVIPDELILERRNLPPRPGEGFGCDTPTEIVTLKEIAPTALMTNVYLICHRGGSRFLISLSHWREDRRDPQLRHIAYNVARSIRFVEPPGLR